MTTHQVAATDDAPLIRRAQAGDRDAFGELVQRHMRRAYAVALGLTGSPDDALDLSQEAFARAYRARRRIDPDRPFYAWLHQILRRLCFNYLRDRGRRREKLEAMGPSLAEESRARGTARNPERELEAKELRRSLAKAVASLPEREREVLVLKEVEDLRYREIAEVVGIPIGTVMSRLYSARKRLGRELEGQGLEDER